MLGLGTVAEHAVDAALDWLGGEQHRVENGLARRHLRDGMLVLYDVSSSDVEGRQCPLARFGHRRSDRPPTVYGLLCTKAGLPVAVAVFDGNTADPTTLGAQVDKLKKRFRLARVVLVGDRGMIATARIRADLQPAGLDWIACLRAPQIRALATVDGPLQLSLFDDRDLAEIASPDDPGERLVVCRNPDLAAGRARKRSELLAATERDLARIQERVRRARKPLQGAAAIGQAVGAVLNRRKVGKHFQCTITETDFCFARALAAIEAEARLDGIYVIRTSVAAKALSAGETVQAYKDLARVERAFRSLKTVDLDIRPIRHWPAPRVRAHVFVAFIAYCPQITLRARLEPLASGLTPRAILDQLAAIQMLVHFLTTDGRALILSRYTQPTAAQKILIQQLNLTLPSQSPPRITAAGQLVSSHAAPQAAPPM